VATLRDIRRRIRSVQSTQKITRAMKLVAAAKLRRAQERVLEARPYGAKLAELVATLARGLGEDKHPLMTRRGSSRMLYVVVTADKGLCGAFNANILRRSLEALRAAAEPTIVAVGRKARDFYRRRAWRIRADRVGLLDRPTVAEARTLAAEVMRAFLEDEVDEVWLV
jgi:F-type H+-transporting ATPase subunit gamma